MGLFCSVGQAEDAGAGIIMVQDAAVVDALCTHGGCAYLAEAYAVSPAGTVQDEVAALAVDDESGAVEVRFAQGAADEEFLADAEAAECAYDAE